MSDNLTITDTIKIATSAFELCSGIDDEDTNIAHESRVRLESMNQAPLVSNDEELPKKNNRGYHFRDRRILSAAFELNERRFRYFFAAYTHCLKITQNVAFEY